MRYHCGYIVPASLAAYLGANVLLDLNLLVALDVLLVERKIARAAEGLSLSQSAFSGRLAKAMRYFRNWDMTAGGPADP
uniref:HTH lysR-type domain-containing protein n=1 Tax=Paraburkholderia sprentiae WSM5005 TaxID=754502 RepID=A0A1I9YWF2_9BURK